MRILIQGGHEGRTTGATGAPNEQAFNIDIANQVADQMRSRGVEVRRVNADPKSTEISGDWDLFLAIHYDADVYGTGGCLVDFPTPATDGVTDKSQAIAKALLDEYTATTKIVSHPERSNANTRNYYMWSKISLKTPCVIIECGVGMHVPDDHTVLHFNRPLVVDGIVRGLCKGLSIPYSTETLPSPCAELVKSYEDQLVKNRTEIAEKTATIAQFQIDMADGSRERGLLVEENQKLSEQVAYYLPYKNRYEVALTKTVDKYTGRQLISMGVKKLLNKK